MAEEKTILLTQEAYDKMKEELAWREGEYRDEILSKVSAARAEGDLSENGGYQAAREAQRVNQGRIDELTVKLRNAKILTAPKAGEVGDQKARHAHQGGLHDPRSQEKSLSPRRDAAESEKISKKRTVRSDGSFLS